MKERPILFSASMVRAILEGRKTQTRRVVKYRNVERFFHHGENQVAFMCSEGIGWSCRESEFVKKCPYGVPGDRLWVRESLVYKCNRFDETCTECGHVYAATPDVWVEEYVDQKQMPRRNVPSIHMPRWSSRITLEVVSVRVQRLQEISEADAIAEGVQSVRDHYGDPSVPLIHCGTVAWQRYDGAACAAPSARLSYQSLWESINCPGSWDANPWVWVVEFKRLEQP